MSTTSQIPTQRTGEQQLGRNYDRAAWFYEKSAKIYSTNQIRASKRYQLNHIEPGQNVCTSAPAPVKTRSWLLGMEQT